MTDEASTNEVMMKGSRARSRYMPIATKAAKLEAEGALDAAGKLWGHAAAEAIKEVNREWAMARQKHCGYALKK
ncbi:ANR family transcriptional regulator [Aeromonas veronii]|uniref:ANR family transcriptional regulator n=1 Tax=Aeromonas TaxID=642 RepID=UPI0022EB6953|nr:MULTISPECIES: ANR family transcriptional regulator [Aeromonas]KAJ8740028.1 ANR family transcriptional regulator [Aeromonas veronii]MDA3317846.1 ANR family transcriptional regulator [Aeromonas sp. PI_26]